MNYQSATRLRCFEFTLGFIFAPDPESAEAIATEAGLWNKRPDGTWGDEASEAHAQLTRDMLAAFRNLAGGSQHVSYPHEPGYLYDCPACEARCHCAPGSAPCVFDGPHANQRETRYSATIRFADGNTRYNGIATEAQLAEWLGRYGVAWSAADGQRVVYGAGSGVTSVDIERFEISFKPEQEGAQP